MIIPSKDSSLDNSNNNLKGACLITPQVEISESMYNFRFTDNELVSHTDNRLDLYDDIQISENKDEKLFEKRKKSSKSNFEDSTMKINNKRLPKRYKSKFGLLLNDHNILSDGKEIVIGSIKKRRGNKQNFRNNKFKTLDVDEIDNFGFPVEVYPTTNYGFTTSKNIEMMKTSKNLEIRVRCTCEKSKCLKKYCECYSKGLKCSKDTCKCVNCHNTIKVKNLEEEHNKENLNLENLPNVYKEFSNLTDGLLKKKRNKEKHQEAFCNCTKSKCNKQYCECFKKNKTCNIFCRCISCLNKEKHKSIYENQITKQSFDHISISIINNQLTISNFTENIPILPKISKKRRKPIIFKIKELKEGCKSPYGKKLRTPVFTTTCESTTTRKISNIQNIISKLTRDRDNRNVRRKIEMKKFNNQNIFEKEHKIENSKDEN